MKTLTHKPQLYKWSLVGLLIGSAGFSLSMNPQHFNIARHDMNKVYSLDLASTVCDAKKTTKEKDACIAKEAAAAKAKKAVPKPAPAAGKTKAKVPKDDNTDVDIGPALAAAGVPAPTAILPQAKAEATTTAAPVVAADKTKPEKSETPAAAATSSSRKITVLNDAGRSYEVTIVSKGSDNYSLKFNKPDQTEGTVCELCSTEYSLQAKDEKEIFAKINKLIKGDKSETASTDDDNEGKDLTDADKARIHAQKKGQATEIIPEEWEAKAEVCDAKKDADNKMECHSKVILALSAYLKDDKSNAKIVNKYFLDHMRSELANALKAKTVKTSRRAEDCDSADSDAQVFPIQDSLTGRAQCLIVDSSKLELANRTVSDLIESLKEKNGETTIVLLAKMKAGSYAIQMQNAKDLAQLGKSSNNLQLYSLGMDALNPTSLTWGLQDDFNQLIDSADGSSIKENALENAFFRPTNNMLADYSKYVAGTHSEGSQNNLPNDPLKYQIPTNLLAMTGSASTGSSSASHIAGEPGNIPATWYEQRIQNWRGSTGVTIDLPWATSGMSSGVQSVNPFNPAGQSTPAIQPNVPGFQTQNDVPTGVVSSRLNPMSSSSSNGSPTIVSRSRN